MPQPGISERITFAPPAIPEEAIGTVHTPIRAVTPEEIAVSIADEMICQRTIRREGSSGVHHACPMHKTAG